ncbi:MAG: chromate transporter [Acidobacteriaceae bacterium]|jgi:chromate transporter|nr:chromate transporter [Acidobacteriaceae bacterium]MDQ1404505.1 chromate transporter [Acidobacteriaceae bacterium]
MPEQPALHSENLISEKRQVPLGELALFFLRLGTTAFGGPAAHIAVMEYELVRRRAWLSREKFLDLLGASNLIPGPSSSELAIHIGYLCAGWRGLLVAGSCFILPATLMVGGLASLYVRFGKLPAMAGILFGIKPVVISVILQALWNLGRTAVKTTFLAIVAGISLLLSAFGLHPLLLLVLAGVVACLPALKTSRALFSIHATGLISSAAATAVSFSLISLFLVFLKIGATVFGSGYVLLAFLRADLVTHRGWLTDAQLVDAVAVGQVTPGPVFTTATFIGFVLGGIRGAVLSTVGIFLPAFLLVAVSGPIVPRIRQSKIAGAFLDGVNVGSLALMAAVTWQLGRASLVDTITVLLAVVSLIALLRFRVNSVWLILLGAITGLIATAFHR